MQLSSQAQDSRYYNRSYHQKRSALFTNWPLWWRRLTITPSTQLKHNKRPPSFNYKLRIAGRKLKLAVRPIIGTIDSDICDAIAEWCDMPAVRAILAKVEENHDRLWSRAFSLKCRLVSSQKARISRESRGSTFWRCREWRSSVLTIELTRSVTSSTT